MPLLKYTSFTTSESFEKWQQENPKNVVSQIIPTPVTIKGNMMNTPEGAGGQTGEAQIAFNIFVVYWEKSQPQP